MINENDKIENLEEVIDGLDFSESGQVINKEKRPLQTKWKKESLEDLNKFVFGFPDRTKAEFEQYVIDECVSGVKLEILKLIIIINRIVRLLDGNDSTLLGVINGYMENNSADTDIKSITIKYKSRRKTEKIKMRKSK